MLFSSPGMILVFLSHIPPFTSLKDSIEMNDSQMDFSAIPDAEGSVEKFLHIPYNQRWEYLKPTMVRIYMEENSRFASLAKRMKDVYSFDAQSVYPSPLLIFPVPS